MKEPEDLTLEKESIKSRVPDLVGKALQRFAEESPEDAYNADNDDYAVRVDLIFDEAVRGIDMTHDVLKYLGDLYSDFDISGYYGKEGECDPEEELEECDFDQEAAESDIRVMEERVTDYLNSIGAVKKEGLNFYFESDADYFLSASMDKKNYEKKFLAKKKVTKERK